MILETVRSSAIHAIGYEIASRELEVIFNGGGIYRFYNVSPEIFAAFISAPSKGSFFQDCIRGRFRHARLGKYRERRAVIRRLPARHAGAPRQAD